MTDYTLTIKVFSGNDTRRFSLSGSQLTMECLEDQLVRCFGEDIVRISEKTYLDPDGDEISLKHDIDLKEAVNISKQSGSVLKMNLKPLFDKNPKNNLKSAEDENSLILEKSEMEVSEEKHVVDVKDEDSNIEEDTKIEENSSINEKGESDVTHRFQNKETSTLSKEFINLTNKYSIDKLDTPIEEVQSRVNNLLNEIFGTPPNERHFRSNLTMESLKSRFQNKITQSNSPHSSINLSSYKMSLVDDVTIPAESKVVRNSMLTKIWRVVNSGTIPWPSGVTLSHIGGDSIPFLTPQILKDDVAPNETIDLELNFLVPDTVGRYISHFKLITPENEQFGQRLYLDIDSIENYEKEPTDNDDLDKLRQMGFMHDEQYLLNLLKENNGNISATIESILT